jgi:hypothetical protein
MRAALGTALLSGIFVGEAAFGLTVVADSTSSVYWVAIGMGGAILLIGMVSLRVRGWLPITVRSWARQPWLGRSLPLTVPWAGCDR